MATTHRVHQSVPRPGAPDGFHIRAASFGSVRSDYVREVLTRRGIDPSGRRALVVGSGRGLLAIELARSGFTVTGIDPSETATEIARSAADADGLELELHVGNARSLPFDTGTFDVVYVADTFETTDDLDDVVAELARVLADGGTLIYDTVNRTKLSKLIYLGAFQTWRWSRMVPPGRYAWERLRPPDELATTLATHGLTNGDVRGFLPGSPVRLVRATLRARRGRISDPDLAKLAGMHLAPVGKKPPVTYLGFATKQA